ncbi:MAG: hypothetical protein A3J97_11095 [Spirochaetes bacterium RIFOXYC1_FULL_54_7]|nr:MAG: hypothetical protein A3J97_11095 [Spirochaetes bacterium RIFOXYC1_FULL_54_7]
MAINYTKAQAREILAMAKEMPDHLYTLDCLKWTGEATDSREPFTEILAGVLLSGRDAPIQDELNRILPIPRKLPYFVNHKYADLIKTFDSEARFAKALLKAGQMSDIGIIVDEQVPLKANRVGWGGKIDLVSEKGEELIIIELKYYHQKRNTIEGILRPIIEISTYAQQLQVEKFLSEYNTKYTANKKRVSKAILLQWNKYKAEIQGIRNHQLANIRKLIEILGIRVFVFELNEDIMVTASGIKELVF